MNRKASNLSFQTKSDLAQKAQQALNEGASQPSPLAPPPRQSVQESRKGKVGLTIFVPDAFKTHLKKLAAEENTTIQELAYEAFWRLLDIRPSEPKTVSPEKTSTEQLKGRAVNLSPEAMELLSEIEAEKGMTKEELLADGLNRLFKHHKKSEIA